MTKTSHASRPPRYPVEAIKHHQHELSIRSYLLEQHGDLGPPAGKAPRKNKLVSQLATIEEAAAAATAAGMASAHASSAARRRPCPARSAQRRRGQGESLAPRWLHFVREAEARKRKVYERNAEVGNRKRIEEFQVLRSPRSFFTKRPPPRPRTPPPRRSAPRAPHCLPLRTPQTPRRGKPAISKREQRTNKKEKHSTVSPC